MLNEVNLIIKSKPVNWKPITGDYWSTGFLSTLPLLLSILRLHTELHSEYFIMKGKDV